jgi:dynein heavy chain
MEDVNSLLNTGDIPNLFSTEEFVPLIDKLRTWAKKEGFVELVENGTNLQYYEYFVKSAKKKLHIMVGMSPIGDSLRNNIRMFPSIVNCCTINCFHEWPEEALEAVAKKLLIDSTLDNAI